MNDGVLYAAIGAEYIELAFLSAESIRQRHPDMQIALFTDDTRHPLCQVEMFNAVLDAGSYGEENSVPSWSRGQLVRLAQLPRSPYERTLHLDADTRVVSDNLPQLFDVLTAHDDLTGLPYEIAMVECADDASLSRRAWGKPMYSAGFVLYRMTEKVMHLLFAWLARTDQNFMVMNKEPERAPSWPALAHIADSALRRQLLGFDQISLVELLSPTTNKYDVTALSLPHAWNYTPSKAGSGQLPQIVHNRALRALVVPDLLQAAHRYDTTHDFVGGKTRTRCVTTIEEYVRQRILSER